jgi:hypothetical protein
LGKESGGIVSNQKGNGKDAGIEVDGAGDVG